MQHVDFKPRGVCSRMIHIDLSDDGKTIEDVSFDGGCSGNLAAIGKLVSGRPTEEVAQILKGNTCGPPQDLLRGSVLAGAPAGHGTDPGRRHRPGGVGPTGEGPQALKARLLQGGGHHGRGRCRRDHSLRLHPWSGEGRGHLIARRGGRGLGAQRDR
mgnify:CR=1 FL=1